MRFDQCINYFEEWARRKYSARTTEIYIGHLRRFSTFINAKDIESVQHFEDVMGYIRHLERRGINDSTINLAMIALRQLWKAIYGLERQFGIQVPFLADMIPVKSGVVTKSHQPIDVDDFEKLLVAVQDSSAVPFMRLRDLTIFRMLYDTGVRISELTALDVSSLDLVRRSAKVITRKRRDAVKFRDTFWTLDTHFILLNYLEMRSTYTQDGPLFINLDDHGRISPRSIQRILKTYLKAAGIDPSRFSPHSFRHSVGKRAAAEQMYPPLLQALLGHRNTNSSVVYYNVQNESLRKEYHAKLGDMRPEKVYQAVKDSAPKSQPERS
jgi:site-specific recombinase XerD